MLAKYIQDANTDYRRIRQRIPLGPLRTAADYNRAVAVLDEILDEIGQQETHPLSGNLVWQFKSWPQLVIGRKSGSKRRQPNPIIC